MKSTLLRTAGLLVLGAALLGQPALQATSQSIQNAADRPHPDKNLPADFIDSRPILAYYDNRPMPDTVRGLLEELKHPDRCGKDASLRPDQACALVFYKLDDTFTPDRLRPPFIMKAIYRITEPENLANTVMTMPDGKGVLQTYANEDLFEPLRNVRANICLHDKRMPERCSATDSKGVLYRPFGILGKLENDREDILPVKSARKHFAVDAESPAFAEWLKQQQIRDLCRQISNFNTVTKLGMLAC